MPEFMEVTNTNIRDCAGSTVDQRRMLRLYSSSPGVSTLQVRGHRDKANGAPSQQFIVASVSLNLEQLSRLRDEIDAHLSHHGDRS